MAGIITIFVIIGLLALGFFLFDEDDWWRP